MADGSPFTESSKHTYFQICEKVRKFYGVPDAEKFYRERVKEIKDRCGPDAFGLARFDSLKEFWENRQMESKWRGDEVQPQKHGSVEIYAVRAPGAGGELGVLTTEHELDSFVSGLATACAKYISKDSGRDTQVERDLNWIFKNAFPIAFKLAGYKAEQVVERHVLMCGSNAPNADDILASA